MTTWLHGFTILLWHSQDDSALYPISELIFSIKSDASNGFNIKPLALQPSICFSILRPELAVKNIIGIF
jgi:hypothetical protein